MSADGARLMRMLLCDMCCFHFRRYFSRYCHDGMDAESLIQHCLSFRAPNARVIEPGERHEQAMPRRLKQHGIYYLYHDSENAGRNINIG